MAENSNELRHQVTEIWNRMRDMNTQAEAEGRNLTDAEKGEWAGHSGAILDLQERIKRAEYLDSIPAPDRERQTWALERDRQAGPPTTPEEATAREHRAYSDAFRTYITARDTRLIGPEVWDTLHRRGQPALSPDAMAALPANYQAALSTTSQTAGGFWIPDEQMQAIEKAMLYYGGMMEFADTITTATGADLPFPVYDDTANVGRRLAENTAMTVTDMAVGLRTMKAFTYSSDEILASVQLVNDWPDQALSIINDALGERVGRAMNTDFTNNAAPDGPQGLLTATTLGVTAAAINAVTAEEVRRLIWAIPLAYRNDPSCQFMMHDNTYRDICGLVDGNGLPYFMTDPRSGANPQLWGRSVVVNNDMPVMATTTRSIVFGKGSAYKIRRVQGMTLLRLDERYAPSLQVSFLGFARADGGLIDAGQHPIQHLAMA